MTKDAAGRRQTTARTDGRTDGRTGGRCELSTQRKCAHSSRITANVSNVRGPPVIQRSAAVHCPLNLRGIGDRDVRLVTARFNVAFARCANCLIIVVVVAVVVVVVVVTFYLVFVAKNERAPVGVVVG